MKLKKIITDTTDHVTSVFTDMSFLNDDKKAKFYATAEQEILDGVMNSGLWSQSFVKAKGNEDVRKSIYVKERAKQLIADELKAKCKKEVEQKIELEIKSVNEENVDKSGEEYHDFSLNAKIVIILFVAFSLLMVIFKDNCS